ncbi:MAG: M20 family metallopeptidase [Oscillospiraceae bacterium]
MPDFIALAKSIEKEVKANRRYLHENAEVGDNLPKTTAFIKNKLTEYGCAYQEICKCGIVANIGAKGGKTILIRADTDALPQQEISGESFSCRDGAAHSCGHDIHTASLLGCAKILKDMEHELSGNVKLVFQPDEEKIFGAVNMIKAGVMENPKVDAAFSMHTNFALKAGEFNVLGGTYLPSSDIFKINISGVGAHSSAPDKGVDPILAAAKIIDGVQTLTSREIDALTPVILTFGSVHAGEAANVIPETAELCGTIRAFDRDVRNWAKKRFCEMTESIAKTYRADARVEFTSATPATYNDPIMSGDILKYLRELFGNEIVFSRNLNVKGSDDFAYYSELVPGVMYHVGMGTAEEGYTAGLHNPAARFDEGALVNSVAAFAQIAYCWLAEHRQ